MARKSYQYEEPSSSQFVPEDEEVPQRAAMREDNKTIAKIYSRQDDDDPDYEAGHEPSSSQASTIYATPRKPVRRFMPARDSHSSDEEEEDSDEDTGSGHSRGSHSDEDGDYAEDSTEKARSTAAMPENITATFLLIFWFVLLERRETRLAFDFDNACADVKPETEHGVSFQHARIVYHILQEELRSDSIFLDGDEVKQVVKEEWSRAVKEVGLGRGRRSSALAL